MTMHNARIAVERAVGSLAQQNATEQHKTQCVRSEMLFAALVEFSKRASLARLQMVAAAAFPDFNQARALQPKHADFNQQPSSECAALLSAVDCSARVVA